MSGANGSPVREKCAADALLARGDRGGGGPVECGVHGVVCTQQTVEVGGQQPVFGLGKAGKKRTELR